MYAETGTKFYDEKRNLLYEMQEEGTLCVNGLLHPKDERCEYDIPLEYEGFKITAIGKEAFSNKKITKIIISDSVTKIGEGAFCGSRISEIYLPSSVRIIEDAAFSSCPNLMNINVSENNCFFQSVDGVLFNKALTQILKYPAGRKNERYKIPETVLDICDRAFGDCDYLTSIDIPDSVSYLGFGAFEDCDGLSSIFIPSSVRAIEYGAIDFCKNLESITVAEDNRFFCSVEGVLFDKSMSTLCMYPRGRKESSYTIPKGVKYLKASSLHCPNMIYLNIPSSVIYIEESFNYCPELIDINIAKDNPVFSSIDGVMFDKSGSTLIKYPKGRKETHYTIPEAVIEINKEAFEDCKNLKKINVDKKKGSIIEESWYAREGIEIVWQE